MKLLAKHCSHDVTVARSRSQRSTAKQCWKCTSFTWTCTQCGTPEASLVIYRNLNRGSCHERVLYVSDVWDISNTETPVFVDRHQSASVPGRILLGICFTVSNKSLRIWVFTQRTQNYQSTNSQSILLQVCFGSSPWLGMIAILCRGFWGSVLRRLVTETLNAGNKRACVWSDVVWTGFSLWTPWELSKSQ